MAPPKREKKGSCVLYQMKNKKNKKKQKKLEKATLHIISQDPPSLRQKELKEKKWMDSQQNSTTAAV